MKRLVWLAPALLLLAACSGAGTTASSGLTSTAGGAPAYAVSKDAIAAPAPAQGNTAPNNAPIPLAFDPTRSVILTANIAMPAAHPCAMSDKAQTVAPGVGGDAIRPNTSGAGAPRAASLSP